MYNLRSRPGIHQTQQMSKTDSEHQTTKLRSSKSSSSSGKKHHKDNDKESETDSYSEDVSEQYNKSHHIYPELPKEDAYDINKEISKLKKQAAEEKYPKFAINKGHHIYPELPKENAYDINKEISKLKQAAEEKYPKLQKEPNPSGVISYVILIVISLAVLIAYFCIACPTDNTAICETPMCLFQTQYKNLRDTFASQDRLSWKIIRSAVISVVNKTEHTQPAVILLVANKDAKMISSCIANYLASLVESSYGNSHDYPKIQYKRSANSEKMKEIIYTTFKKSFGKENHHVIVLENIDTFSADTAMALHLFCDHENAPYKNIVIILTAIVKDFSVDKELRSRDMHSIAQNHLDQVWKYELEEEKRAALLSRITASVAVIHTEKNVPSICHN